MIGRSSAGRPVLAYVVNSLHPGGTERLVIEMSRAFAEDFRVQVFCLDEPGLWARELRHHGIPVHCLWRQPGLDLRMPFELARLFRACGAEIVHAHQCTAWFYAALSRMLYRGTRLLLEEHGRFFPEVDRLARRWVNKLLIARLTDRFVAVSEDVRGRLARYEGLDPARVELIYNGVTPALLMSRAARDARRRELGFGPDCFVVGTVGRFDPIKNLPMLVRGIEAARKRDARVCGLLVGDGPELGPVRELVERCALTDWVRLPGYRDDARSIVQCMDLFVLSSLSEGTSMALLEAMAAEVPVAVTAVGGNPEIVLAGETGWIVPTGAIEALAAVILEAAEDPQLRIERASAGRRRFEEQFTFASMISRYRRLYHSLAPPRGRAGAGA